MNDDDDRNRKQRAKAEGKGESSVHWLTVSQCHCSQTQGHLKHPSLPGPDKMTCFGIGLGGPIVWTQSGSSLVWSSMCR